MLVIVKKKARLPKIVLSVTDLYGSGSGIAIALIIVHGQGYSESLGLETHAVISIDGICLCRGIPVTKIP